MKGSDVYLECGIKANPPAKRVEWYHNVSTPTKHAHIQIYVTDNSATINTLYVPLMCALLHTCITRHRKQSRRDGARSQEVTQICSQHDTTAPANAFVVARDMNAPARWSDDCFPAPGVGLGLNYARDVKHTSKLVGPKSTRALHTMRGTQG